MVIVVKALAPEQNPERPDIRRIVFEIEITVAEPRHMADRIDDVLLMERNHHRRYDSEKRKPPAHGKKHREHRPVDEVIAHADEPKKRVTNDVDRVARIDVFFGNRNLPAHIRMEKAVPRRMRILFLIGERMMQSSVGGDPRNRRAFTRENAKRCKRALPEPRRHKRPVREQAVISDRDAETAKKRPKQRN
jgi:hypothetical protein